jgi:magnesium chelatase family protein
VLLLLDEFPLFRSDVIDALRQPLESGEVTIARGEESATYPARGMVVMACNPCPCGGYAAGIGGNQCRCPELSRRHYQRRITGPIQDRIDIVRNVFPPMSGGGDDPSERRDSSLDVRARVTAARERQRQRFAGRSWRLNSQIPSSALVNEWPLPDSARRLLDKKLYDGQLSRRGAVRVHRLAWTVADVRGGERPDDQDVETALQLRSGDPLLVSAMERRAS